MKKTWRDELGQPLFPTQWSVPLSIKLAFLVGALLWILLLGLVSNAVAQEVVAFSGYDSDGAGHHFACIGETGRCSYAIMWDEGTSTERSIIGAGPLVTAQEETEESWPIFCITADWAQPGSEAVLGETACFIYVREEPPYMRHPIQGETVDMLPNPPLAEYIAKEYRRLKHEESNPWSAS